jgi:hypothetical protein
VPLTESTFLPFARLHYNNPACTSVREFAQDLEIFKYAKRCLKQVDTGDTIKITLLLNHIKILINLFGMEPAIEMLLFKLPEFKSTISSYLVFLGHIEEPTEVNQKLLAWLKANVKTKHAI